MIRGLGALYAKNISMNVRAQLQYRYDSLVRTLAFLVEPVVYLTVWTTIADQRGGEVGGLATGTIAAYFIVWMAVRVMNVVFTPYGFEWRIQRGDFNAYLLRPAHPIHYDLSFFAGYNLLQLLTWLPVAAVLVLAFRPTLDLRPLEVAVFVVALWGAYLVRSMFLWALGMVNFWTTRASALFELYVVCELLFSGRLVPMDLMPQALQSVAGWLPFYWTFGFPIDTLVVGRSNPELATGLAMQVLWTAVGAGLVALVWRRAVRRYTAVGN
ncbi:MAG: ABC transporter permease [Micromonosporaceae bacterium]|nr:ABC transporter permease [Micromonosporaceae bacterium]